MPFDKSKLKEMGAAALTKHRIHEWEMAKEDEDKIGSTIVVYETIGSTELQIEFENGDKNRTTLKDAAVAAVKRVTKLGITVPSMRILISPAEGVRNIAYMGNRKGERQNTMFLGPKMLKYEAKADKPMENVVKGGMGKNNVRGVPDQAYDLCTFGKEQARAEAVVIHEIGHILHERHAEQVFWNLKVGFGNPKDIDYKPPPQPPGDLNAKVSQYVVSQMNYLEFVAEVFTGRCLGITYDKDVLAEYAAVGGYWA